LKQNFGAKIQTEKKSNLGLVIMRIGFKCIDDREWVLLELQGKVLTKNSGGSVTMPIGDLYYDAKVSSITIFFNWPFLHFLDFLFFL